MFWFYAGTIAVAALAIGFFFYRRTRETVSEGKESDSKTAFETADELGMPPDAVDLSEAFQRDREAGVNMPRVAPPVKRNLRTDNLSKEVEVAWEAADVIDFPAGATASPHESSGRSAIGHSTTGDRASVHDPVEHRTASGRDSARVVLMARDPSWLYAYWNVAHEKYRELQHKRLDEWGLSRPILRLYDLTQKTGEHTDIYLNDDADNWYIRVDKPNHRLVAEIGRAFPDGFTAFARSNEVTMPPRGVSMEIAEEWAPLAWDAYYGKAGEPSGLSSPMSWGRTKE